MTKSISRKTGKGHKHMIYKIKEIEMVLNPMKRYSITIVIRGMQVKGTLRKDVSPLGPALV